MVNALSETLDVRVKREGKVFAVAQLLNRRDGQPFTEKDEAHFASFIQSIGVIFETQLGLTERDW